MNVQTVGYKRVSTVDQNTARQLDGMVFDKVFEDKASGKDTQRPGLQKLREHVREGDTVVVHSMDRLARNLRDLLQIVEEFTAKGVKVQFLKENLTFTGDDTPINRLLLSVMGAVVAFEREMILERQREGIALAKLRGVYKGRKKALSAAQVVEMKQKLTEAKSLGQTQAEVARQFKISRETLRKYAMSAAGQLAPQPPTPPTTTPSSARDSLRSTTRLRPCSSTRPTHQTHQSEGGFPHVPSYPTRQPERRALQLRPPSTSGC